MLVSEAFHNVFKKMTPQINHTHENIIYKQIILLNQDVIKWSLIKIT